MEASNAQIIILTFLSWIACFALGWVVREETLDIKKSTHKSAK